jgi:hypothetical protein
MPALKFVYIHSKKPVGKSRESHFPHFSLYQVFHLVYGHVRPGELTISIAMTAILRAFQPVSFSSAMIGIFAQWHAATLTEFVGFSHIF